MNLFWAAVIIWAPGIIGIVVGTILIVRITRAINQKTRLTKVDANLMIVGLVCMIIVFGYILPFVLEHMGD